jgi:mRNA interferase RelE/StbE
VIYKIILAPHAIRDYKKLAPETKQDIRAGIDTLKKTPIAGAKVKRLRGRLRKYHRYRVGDFRIVYAVDSSQHVVYVDYIQHRRDVYRRAG